MSKENDGGPAFPVAKVQQDWNQDTDSFDGVYTEIVGGMKLRDYFAAKAIQSFSIGALSMTPEQCAKIAYLAADAMLEERER